MNRLLIGSLAVIGALAVLWLLMLGAVAAYDTMSDGSMMDGMDGMMRSMMGGDGAETAGSASGSGAVEITDFRFEPTELTVTLGTVVTWTNEDSAPHTATARDDSFDSGRLEEGDSHSETFDTAGSFAYICDLHPWMEGAIVVQ